MEKIMKIGDIVVRRSYGKDITFKIIDVREIDGKESVILKGINIRIIADSTLDDLELAEEDSGSTDKILNTRVKESDYYELCMVAENEKSFCHHDFTYHNIILNDKNDVYIIDFDFCKRELRTFDIANFMIKVLKRVDWDMSFASAIIEAYNSVSKLSDEEYKVLYAFLQFPQRYWRLANRYYYNEVNWGQNTFYKKLQGIVDEKEQYLKLLDEYEQEYL